MEPNFRVLLLLLSVLALLSSLLLTACSSKSSPTGPGLVLTRQVQVPPLPTEARVSQVPRPLTCYPSCLQGLEQQRVNELNLLTGSTSPDMPAK